MLTDWHVLGLIHRNLSTYSFHLFLEDLAFQYFRKSNMADTYLLPQKIVLNKIT
jgi:hypothetical protein